MSRTLILSMIGLLTLACAPAPVDDPDASSPPPEDAASDGGAVPSVIPPCQAYIDRVSECVPGYDERCRVEALGAACGRLIVDRSPLLSLSFCLGRGGCEDPLFRSGCVDTLVESTPRYSELAGVVEALCAACPSAAAAGAPVSTPAECEAFVEEALAGGGGVTHQIARNRLHFLSGEQLEALRDCVTEHPSCDAWDPSLCGQVYRDLDALLDPALSGPTCE